MTAPTQPQPASAEWPHLLDAAQQIVEAKPTWKRFIDGTSLSNDIAVWMADFAHATIVADHAAVQQLTAEVARLREEAQQLRTALRVLYNETANYIEINKLGPVHHNLSMRLARAALDRMAEAKEREGRT